MVVDHSPLRACTFYQHMDALFVPLMAVLSKPLKYAVAGDLIPKMP